MDYNSVIDMFDAGIANMEVIYTGKTVVGLNTKTIAGTPWLTVKDVAVGDILAYGRSRITINPSLMEINLNYKSDAGMHSLYREEGTIQGFHKFLKIRWCGYATARTSKYPLEYDIVLWDTGEISIHMVAFPASSNTGTYSIVTSSTYTYTISSILPDVTLKYTADGINISNDMIEVEGAQAHYLVRSGSNYYKFADGALVPIEVTELTSSVFLSVEKTSIPPISLLIDLLNPELLCFYDESKELNNGLVISGTPRLSLFYYETQNMSEHMGIERVDVFVTGDAKFAVTFDDGTTWKYYNGHEWVVATTDNEGMIINTLRSIPPYAWTEVVTSSTFKFRCALLTPKSTAGQMYIKYI